MRFGKEFLQEAIRTTMRRCESTEVTSQRYTYWESRVGRWPRPLRTRNIGDAVPYVTQSILEWARGPEPKFMRQLI
jgi:hypothetical protein